MSTAELTRTINTSLATLKSDFNNLPTGGGLETLKARLMHLKDKVNGLVAEIDHLNGIKDPKNTPIKPKESYYTNRLGGNQGEAA